MKKTVMHKCSGCGNAYYYREPKLGKRCMVCSGRLVPDGYRMSTFLNQPCLVPIIPMPPSNKPKDAIPLNEKGCERCRRGIETISMKYRTGTIRWSEAITNFNFCPMCGKRLDPRD